MSTDLEPQALTAEELDFERGVHFAGDRALHRACRTCRFLVTLDAARSQPVTSDLVAALRTVRQSLPTVIVGPRTAELWQAFTAIERALSASESTPQPTWCRTHKAYDHCEDAILAAQSAEYRRLSGETP